MFWRHNRLGIAWALLILLLCGLPGSEFSSTKGFTGIDKWIHALFFAVLVVLLCVGFLKQNTFQPLHRLAVRTAFFFSLSYGVLIELLQGTVFVGRSIEFDDALANLAGTLIGLLAFYWIYGRPLPLWRSRKWLRF